MELRIEIARYPVGAVKQSVVGVVVVEFEVDFQLPASESQITARAENDSALGELAVHNAANAEPDLSVTAPRHRRPFATMRRKSKLQTGELVETDLTFGKTSMIQMCRQLLSFEQQHQHTHEIAAAEAAKRHTCRRSAAMLLPLPAMGKAAWMTSLDEGRWGLCVKGWGLGVRGEIIY